MAPWTVGELDDGPGGTDKARVLVSDLVELANRISPVTGKKPGPDGEMLYPGLPKRSRDWSLKFPGCSSPLHLPAHRGCWWESLHPKSARKPQAFKEITCVLFPLVVHLLSVSHDALSHGNIWLHGPGLEGRHNRDLCYPAPSSSLPHPPCSSGPAPPCCTLSLRPIGHPVAGHLYGALRRKPSFRNCTLPTRMWKV